MWRWWAAAAAATGAVVAVAVWRHHTRSPLAHTAVPEEVDFLVVGGGTAAGPLAAELAKHGFVTLVLEAGDDTYGLSGAAPAMTALNQVR